MPKHRRVELICKIDTAILPSVMVVLAAVMIFGAALTPPPGGSSIALPKVNHSRYISGAMRRDAIVVEIMRNGDVFFHADRITPYHLPFLIREQLVRGAENKVYIRADKFAPYLSIKEVLDAIYSARIENVSF